MADNRTGVWTDDRTDKLRVMVAEGHSATEISHRLGVRVSRNAVIGKVNRLGLKLGCGPASEPRAKIMRSVADGTFAPIAPKPPVPKATPPKPVKPALALVVQIKPQAVPEPSSEFAKPFGERATRGECWWPIGEGSDTLSCCAKVTRGGLCEAHAMKGYQARPDQDERKRANAQFRALRRWM